MDSNAAMQYFSNAITRIRGGMGTQKEDQRQETLDRIVLVAVGTAAFFLTIGAWVLSEMMP